MSFDPTTAEDGPSAALSLAAPPFGVGGARGLSESRCRTEPSPEDLLEAIAARQDREAFKALFAHFAPRVNAFARRLGVEAQVAEDLAQDVMLTVWRRARLYDRRKAAASTWIFTIARNRRIDLIRREARPDFDPEDPGLQGEAGPAADENLAERRRDAGLREAVARLPEEQARLMRLAYFEDKSHGAIAEELDIPLGTVKSRIRLAMRKLRQMLKDQD
jgi:RNA polymerase sigma factor (sigma-70 family)